LPSHFNCFWKVAASRTSNTVCILESALRNKERVVSTVSFSRRFTFRFQRKSFCSETGSHTLLNQKIAIMKGREYFSNIAQVVLKDSLHETTMFLSTFKKDSNYVKILPTVPQFILRWRLSCGSFCFDANTLCCFSSDQYALHAVAAFSFFLSYFGNKFISTNFVHDNFITLQLQALPLTLFVSVIQLEFLGRFKITVIPNIRFLAPVFY